MEKKQKHSQPNEDKLAQTKESCGQLSSPARLGAGNLNTFVAKAPGEQRQLIPKACRVFEPMGLTLLSVFCQRTIRKAPVDVLKV